MAKLIISTDGRDKVYEIIDDRFTIGSGPDADLQLRGEGVAGIHLTVDKTKAGYRVIDMETKNGTIVNGKQSNQHVLGNGDTVEIGDVKITYIGKGPARAGAAKGQQRQRGQKLESSKYYRHAQPEASSPGARFAIIGSIVLGVILILWLALKQTNPPAADYSRSELNEAIRLCKQGRSEEEQITKTINKFRKMKKKSAEEKKLLSRLISDWDAALEASKGGDKSRTARKDWMAIHNVQMAESGNRDKLRTMCEEFVANYKDAPGAPQVMVRKARNIIEDLEGKGPMTADEKEIARVQALVREGIRVRDHHLAMRGLNSMDKDVKRAHPEAWEKLHRSIRLKSRQYLTPRKNEVRGWLRRDEDIVDEKKDPEKDIYDPAKAREVAIELIFNKLLHSVVRDYLDSPDKSRQAWNQRADERAQALFRELLKEIKPNY